MSRKLLITICVLSPAALTSCVERILQVRSDPPGAQVYVNGESVGRTPLDHPFTFYGTVEVGLRAKDRLEHHELKPLTTPWYQLFPIDFFSEFCIPWTVRDVHVVEVALAETPRDMTPAERELLRQRTEEAKKSLPKDPTIR